MALGPTEPQRLRGPVTNRTWVLLACVGLLVIGVRGIWALAAHGELWWFHLLGFVFGVGTRVDLVRRWDEI